MAFNTVTVDEFAFEAAEEITINPPEDSAPDGGADDVGGQPDIEQPAGDGGQREKQQPEKTFTQSELDRIIGERLAREREKYKGIDTEMQAAKRFAELVGVPIHEAVKRLEEEAAREQAENMAKQMGVNPEYAQRLMQAEGKMQQLEKQNQTIVQQMINEKQRMELKNAPFFSDYESKINELVSNIPGVDVKTAYYYVIGDHLNEILQNASAGARQKTLAEIQKNAKSFVEGSGGGDSGTVSIPREMVEMAKVYGVSPQRLAERMKALKKV